MSNIEIGYLLTPLQQTVIDLTNRFEGDPDVRYQLFAYGQTRTAWRLSREEVEELPTQFKFLSSPTWIREATRGYLIYLEYFLGMIRGEDTPAIVMIEDIPRILAVEDLRSEWLRVPAFCEAVEGLLDALRETLDYFNMQIVCNLVRDAIYRTQHTDDKPSFYPKLPWDQVNQELHSLENAVHCRGRTFYQSRCGKAYEKMESFPGVDPSMSRYVTFTQKQLMTIAAANRGCHGVNAEAIVAMDLPIPEPVPQWRETSTGLIVPGNLK